jgi:FMN phosphatase YigB (HAD superfamily)
VTPASLSALSVDLFDTLLLRAVAQPADVFLRVGARALDRSLVQRHVTPARFQVARQTAEAAARAARRAQTGSSEVTLLEIYAQMPPGVLAASCETLVALETDVERELVYPHPRTVDTAMAATKGGMRTAILSDTYFNVEQVTTLLRAAGIPPELFDEILTSSQERVSKRDGGLFARLMERWPDVRPEDIVHLGDHAHADVAMATRAGLTAEQHDTGDDDTREHLRLEALRYGTPSPELTSLRRLSCSLAGAVGEQERWWFALGASVLGPLLSAFADWVVDECTRDGIRTVRPLMREGALFAEMIAAAAKRGGAGTGLDVRPLFASRASTWLAGIRTFGEADVRRLLQRQQLTVDEALAALGLSASDAPDALRAAAGVRLGAASKTRLGDGLSLEDALLAYLALPDVVDQVQRHAEAARDLVRRYLHQECGAAADIAVVDLGFKGTTGAALAHADSGRRIHQFLVFGAEAVTRLWRDGHDVRVFAAGPIDDADLAGPIVRYPAVLEALLVTGGTTRGYRASDGGVAPVLEDLRTPADQQRAAANCRAGILVFQDRWLSWRRHRTRAAAAVVSSRRLLTAPVHRLLTMPTPDEATRLGRLVHEDNDGGLSIRPAADSARGAAAPSAEAFLSAALESAADFDHTCLWPAGVCEQRWPGEIERHWRLAAGAPDGAPGAIPRLALRARAAGVERLLVWGAGEMGSALVRACRTAGMDVAGVIDSNPAIWGSSVEGVRVLSPAEARDSGPHVYAIGSLAFATDIEQTLRREYRAAAAELQVFSPAAEAAA